MTVTPMTVASQLKLTYECWLPRVCLISKVNISFGRKHQFFDVNFNYRLIHLPDSCSCRFIRSQLLLIANMFEKTFWFQYYWWCFTAFKTNKQITFWCHIEQDRLKSVSKIAVKVFLLLLQKNRSPRFELCSWLKILNFKF